MHGEDFDHDRHLRPSSIALPWAFATMHGYSVYSTFARDRLDPNVVPFLCQLSNRSAANACSSPSSEIRNARREPTASTGSPASTKPKWRIMQAPSSSRLHARGALGAFWWCWADYDLSLASVPPFDRAPHELRFGIVRSDGTLKPVAEMLGEFAHEGRDVADALPAPIADENEHYAGLPESIASEYRSLLQRVCLKIRAR